MLAIGAGADCWLSALSVLFFCFRRECSFGKLRPVKAAPSLTWWPRLDSGWAYGGILKFGSRGRIANAVWATACVGSNPTPAATDTPERRGYMQESRGCAAKIRRNGFKAY